MSGVWWPLGHLLIYIINTAYNSEENPAVVPCYSALEGRSGEALEPREQEKWHHNQSEVISFGESQRLPLPQDRAHGSHCRLDGTLWGTLGPLMCSEQLTACQAFYMHILHASPQGIIIIIKIYEVTWNNLVLKMKNLRFSEQVRGTTISFLLSNATGNSSNKQEQLLWLLIKTNEYFFTKF